MIKISLSALFLNKLQSISFEYFRQTGLIKKSRAIKIGVSDLKQPAPPDPYHLQPWCCPSEMHYHPPNWFLSKPAHSVRNLCSKHSISVCAGIKEKKAFMVKLISTDNPTSG